MECISLIQVFKWKKNIELEKYQMAEDNFRVYNSFDSEFDRIKERVLNQ